MNFVKFLTLCGFSRRDILEEHKLLHMFLSDYDDLMSWLQDLLQHLRSDDLPQSLKASEEALEVHQERRVIISYIEQHFTVRLSNQKAVFVPCVHNVFSANIML